MSHHNILVYKRGRCTWETKYRALSAHGFDCAQPDKEKPRRLASVYMSSVFFSLLYISLSMQGTKLTDRNQLAVFGPITDPISIIEVTGNPASFAC